MAFRQSQRQQQMFLPPSIEEFIGPDHPVRAYDAFVDALDGPSLGLEADPHQAGCPAYPPTSMLKILVYAYSYGIRSSRKIERALQENLSFLWLAGGLKPDFKTIARFRRDHRPALKQVLRDCARLCLKLGVIAGNTLFVDGSKFRANAGNNQSWTAAQCEEHLRQIDERVEELLRECERLDTQEAQEPSLVPLQEELVQQRSRQERIATALQQLQKEDLTRVNITDPDCALMRGRQGSHAGYNSQFVVDEQHGLIVQADVVSDQNDRRQFAPQITAAAETTGKTPAVAGADNGYYSGPELEPMTAVATQVLVPPREPAASSKSFAKDHFTYVAAEDVYVCPAGHRLPCRRTCGIGCGSSSSYPPRGRCIGIVRRRPNCRSAISNATSGPASFSCGVWRAFGRRCRCWPVASMWPDSSGYLAWPAWWPSSRPCKRRRWGSVPSRLRPRA